MTASNLLLEHHIAHQLDRTPTHRQLGLQPDDPALGRSEFCLFLAGQARLQAPVDAVLPPPGKIG
ncbi:hypothetical protein [Actinoallomurus sp. NPDC050550]|uniref:hypothetical protein n=1 Tax=Actinoallomurus sp. NPDC050550 TaxID=3154937 RepID=UPI0033F00129